ncbi:MAG: hypothetical protein HZB25_02775 [Candidatus Eisenbacteria bacterium]|nr:hypothetical protein [Candidatus Eisenbacteria bacterium]
MPDGHVNLDTWLAESGFDTSRLRARAVAALKAGGVIGERPRVNISEDKLGRAAEALRAAFAVHCPDKDCARFAKEAAGGREVVATARREACAFCVGSNSRRAFERARRACVDSGLVRWLVVGGSPNYRQDLLSYLDGAPELEVVLDEGRSHDSRALRARGARAQAIAILATTQINHKDTAVYTRDFKPKVITVPARGLEALFEEMERRAKRGA